MKSNTLYLRHLWSHDAPLHKWAVRIYNASLARVPFTIKYGMGKFFSRRPPYSLIRPGSTVVQVGAPRDTLFAGRSRSVYFSLLAGRAGKVFVVEPDSRNILAYKEYARRHDLTNVVLCPTGAWSEKTNLNIYIDDFHPATNFTEGCKDYDDKKLARYRVETLPVNTIDGILAEHSVSKVDLISITTNGAEQEILAGMKKVIADGLPYISLACTGDNYQSVMSDLGYDLLAYDDRGYTFAARQYRGAGA